LETAADGLTFDLIMSSESSKTVSKTHCYVYDLTSHEECDVEDSTRTEQHNNTSEVDISQTSSKSNQQKGGGSKATEIRGHSANNSRASSGNMSAVPRSDRQLSRGDSLRSGDRSSGRAQDLPRSRSRTSRDRQMSRGDSLRSGDRSSGRAQDRPRSRSRTSKDRTGKRNNTSDDLIVLSDDSGPVVSLKRESCDRQRKRLRTSSRSRSAHKILVRDERRSFQNVIWLAESGTSSRGHRSRSRERRSRSGGKRRSRSRQRSRSRSVGQRQSRNADGEHDRGREKRAKELKDLRARIERVKAEIMQTRMEKDDYSWRTDQIRDNMDMDIANSSSLLPPPSSYDSYRCSPDRLMPSSEMSRSRDDAIHSAPVMSPPPMQCGEYFHNSVDMEMPRERARDMRSADGFGGGVSLSEDRQFTSEEHRSR